jgi:hypothetical protein
MSPWRLQLDKFDISCGLTEKEIAIIRFAIKRALNRRLPILPENVETKLFFEGRDAWTYSWKLRERNQREPLNPLCLEVTAKLKKEFHYLKLQKHHTFSCTVQVGPDIYKPGISIHEESA